MNIDLTVIVQAFTAGIGLFIIKVGWGIANTIERVDERLRGHEQLDDLREVNVNRRIDSIEARVTRLQ